MSWNVLWHVDELLSAGYGYGTSNLTFRTTVADGPVADHPEPVATDRSIEVAEPHRSDLDVMRHG